jgi:hypothetical protein
VLLNQEGDPFQEIMNELAPDEALVYANFLRQRRYEALAPKDAAAARQMLLDLVDRTFWARTHSFGPVVVLRSLERVGSGDVDWQA